MANPHKLITKIKTMISLQNAKNDTIMCWRFPKERRFSVRREISVVLL